MADKIKLLLAVLLVIGGVAGYYIFADAPMIVRVLSVLAGLVLGGVVAGMSQTGRQFFQFAGEARDEAKKVVWPTRKETLQTTAIVFAFVVIMAMFLWLVDGSLLWGMKKLIGRGE